MKVKHIYLNKHTIVYILYAIIAGLVFFTYGLNLNIPHIIILFVTFMLVFCGDDSEIIALSLMCIPLHSCFDYLYTVLMIAIVLIIRNFSVMRINITIFPVMILLIWELVHSMVGDFELRQFVVMAVPYFYVIVLQSMRTKIIDYVLCVRVLAIYTLVMGITLITKVMITSGGSLFYALTNMKRLGINEDTATMGILNPNSLGIICVLAIIGLMQKFLFIKKNKSDIFGILCIAIIGILTVSRTYLVCLFLVILLFIVAMNNGIKSKLALSFGSVCIGGLILVLTYKLLPNTIEMFMGRWQESDLSNGRIEIMQQSMDYIWAEPRNYLFGIGYQNYFENVSELNMIAPHDGINELIMTWGLLGLIIFVIYLGGMVWHANNLNSSLKLVNFIPLIIIVIKGLAGHWISSGYTMLALSFVYLSLVYDFNRQKLNSRISG